MTGHRASGNDDSDWSRLASEGATAVVYMPGQEYGEISSRLQAAGFAGGTACAIVSQATTPGQRIYRTTVSDLDRAPRLPSPTLLVVGEVVKFADRGRAEEVAHLPKLELGFETASARTVRSPAESLKPGEEFLA
jgi:siroheme synthase